MPDGTLSPSFFYWGGRRGARARVAAAPFCFPSEAAHDVHEVKISTVFGAVLAPMSHS